MSHHGKDHHNGVPAGNLPGGKPASDDVASPAQPSDPTGRDVELNPQVNNPVGPGVSHRGDRRDTHPSYSTGKAGRGSNTGGEHNGGRDGPLGASGRKSGPKSD